MTATEPQGLAELRREVFASHAVTLQPDAYRGVLARMLTGKPVKAGEVATVTAVLVAAARDLQISARRYADGRMSYVTAEVNGHTRALLALGVPLNTADGSVYAREGMYGDQGCLPSDGEPETNPAVPVSPGLLLAEIKAEAWGRDLPTARLARLIAGDVAALEEDVTPPEEGAPMQTLAQFLAERGEV